LKRSPWALGVVVSLAARAVGAQEPPPLPPPPPTRPGLLKAGPFYITPRLRLGTIGLDTNVFYTATDRRSDFTATGGPGLEILLPSSSGRFLVDGGVNYVYFLRTESQRRLAGGGRARLEVGGSRIVVGAEGTWIRTFDRPNFEIDRRVVQDTKGVGGDLDLNRTGRLGVLLSAWHRDIEVPEGQPFRGADLSEALSRRERRGTAGLRYRVTPKTSFLLEGDHQQDRFTFDESRDADSNRVYGGLEVVSSTRLAGRAIGGVRLIRFLNLEQDLTTPYADVNLVYHVGPRTRLGVSYTYEVAYTAFRALTETPTLRTQRYGARMEKGLFGRVDLHTYGTYATIRTDGAVRIALEDGGTTRVVRDDRVLDGGANLGYRFPWGLRIAVGGSYTDRESVFADLGVRGLLLGALVTYTPN
jgi:hypothetical protein